MKTRKSQGSRDFSKSHIALHFIILSSVEDHTLLPATTVLIEYDKSTSIKLGPVAVRPFDFLSDDLLLTSLILCPHADGIIKASLSGKLKTLLGRSCTTNDSLVTIEMFGDFLERSVACLDVEKVDDGKLDCEPDNVEDVVFPAQVVEGNRVDVLVEEDCEACQYEMQGQIDEDNSRERSTQRNITVKPFARILYGKISAV